MVEWLQPMTNGVEICLSGSVPLPVLPLTPTHCASPTPVIHIRALDGSIYLAATKAQCPAGCSWLCLCLCVCPCRLFAHMVWLQLSFSWLRRHQLSACVAFVGWRARTAHSHLGTLLLLTPTAARCKHLVVGCVSSSACCFLSETAAAQ